jgi:hypothetical protein
MKIILESQSECDTLEYIINGLERDNRLKKGRKVSQVIADARQAVHIFHIRHIDAVGPVICRFCKKEWIALFSIKTKILKCPKCDGHNKTPQITNNMGEQEQ